MMEILIFCHDCIPYFDSLNHVATLNKELNNLFLNCGMVVLGRSFERFSLVAVLSIFKAFESTDAAKKCCGKSCLYIKQEGYYSSFK